MTVPFTCHCHLYPFTALVSSGVVRWPALTLVHTNSGFDKGLCLTQQWWWGHNATAFRALRTAASGAAGMPLVHCSKAGPMGYQRSQSSSRPQPEFTTKNPIYWSQHGFRLRFIRNMLCLGQTEVAVTPAHTQSRQRSR